MKKFAAFLLLVAFMACNSVGKHSEAITALISNWDSTTEAVTGFTQQLQQQQSSLGGMMQEMNLDDAALAALSGDQKSALDVIKSAFSGHGSSLAALSQQALDFVSQWQEKGNEVAALKDGLAAGKLESDVAGKISGLQETVTDAGSKLEGWQGELQGLTDKINSSYSEFKALMGGQG